MMELALVEVMLAEREREVESIVRRRRLLRPQEIGDPDPAVTRREAAGRSLAVRTRATSG